MFIKSMNLVDYNIHFSFFLLACFLFLGYLNSEINACLLITFGCIQIMKNILVSANRNSCVV
jgi:hypothetical protein